jgi:hypothetical protein
MQKKDGREARETSRPRSTDLDALRGREDLKKLIAELEGTK